MIVVSGATGNIGGEVLRLVAGGGHRVRVLARDPAKVTGVGANVEVVRGDLTQPSTLEPALDGAEKLFLVAGATDLPAIAGHAATAAAKRGVRHVVLVSSGTIDMAPTTIGGWHLAAEERLKASGVAWTMLRPNNFASNALRWAGSIRSQGAVFGPGGDGTSAPIDPRDIAAVAAVALTAPGHEGRTYTLGGPELLTTLEQVQQIGAAIGKALRFVEVPEAAARAAMLKSGMGETIADAILELMRVARAGGEGPLSPSVREVTGVAPRTFAQWAKDHAAAFRA